MISYDDLVQTLMDERYLTYEEATFAVSERYATLDDGHDAHPLFDDPSVVEAEVAEEVMAYHPRSEVPMRSIELRAERSPAGEVAALQARIEAKREGDRYRRLSAGNRTRG